MTDESTTLRHIGRELPRKRVALVLFIVLVSLAITWLRGQAIAHEWHPHWIGSHVELNPRLDVAPAPAEPEPEQEDWSPPWRWTAYQWQETVWPWK